MSLQPIAVIGASGQIGQALQRSAAERHVPLILAGRPDIDFDNRPSLQSFFAFHRPALVINAAAYTAVDKAETEAHAARVANSDGPAILAQLCQNHGAALIHLSTDYVFDGAKRQPYIESDPCGSLNVYGATKAAGEDAVRSALGRHCIVRTAWVYSSAGQNFLKTMLRLGGERDVLRVVADQHGAPTCADDIAHALLDMAPRLMDKDESAPVWGTFHLTASGETTWYGFAEEIFRLARQAGQRVPRLEAISIADYPAPAVRPKYSVLDTSKLAKTFGFKLPDWPLSLASCFERLQNICVEGR